MNAYRFLVSRRWISGIVLILVFAVLCHILAQWQLARRAEARAEIARVLTNYDASPLPIEDVLPNTTDYTIDDKWRPVTLTGRYLPESELLVRNRPCQGASGYDVLTPFKLDSGPVLFVDRGCVPSGSVANTAADYERVTGVETTVVVRLRASEPLVSGRTDALGSAGSIHAPSIAERLGMSAYTAAYGQLAGPERLSAPYLAERPAPDEGPHLSYAFQWYVFTLIAISGYVWSARNERRNRESDAAEVAEGPVPTVRGTAPATDRTSDAALSARYGVSGAGGRRALRRQAAPTDAEFEDALLDDVQRNDAQS